ncbi:hypothetical protein NDU88_010431 [Pleurodeles waltl]|uniref:Uncharacterized protein n=1 Tax=Pleurodeles waltl TaxID=8319 RepID=A0AAV7PXU9_PLEWA|nr:hypothetical protein NDU88_010431 [Pleurodeles waltl]
MEQEVSEETLEVYNFTLKKEGVELGLRDREVEIWDRCQVKVRERGSFFRFRVSETKKNIFKQKRKKMEDTQFIWT